MKFKWNLTEQDFEKVKRLKKREVNYYGDCIGNVRTGELCFDIISRNETPQILDWDLYLGGVEGYAETNDGYPYDHICGGGIEKNIEELTFDEFKEIMESIFTKCIKEENLDDKANMPLHEW